VKKNTRLFSRFPGSSFFARTAAVFLLLLLLLAIPLFVLISQQRQTIKQQAATPSPSIKPLPSSQRSPSSYPLLPEQQIWKNGVSSYIFGTNNTYPFSNQNIETVPAVQQALKDAHIPLIRTWFFSPANADYPQWATDAEIDKRLQVDEFMGAQCLGVLRDISPASFAFYKHVVQYAGNRCNIYEYGNEPGNEGEPGMSTYITSWNTLIPQLRQINPNAKFIGPVNGVSDIATLLKAAQISGVYSDTWEPTAFSIAKSASAKEDRGLHGEGALIGELVQVLKGSIHTPLSLPCPRSQCDFQP
jgi:hypothetical protein